MKHNVYTICITFTCILYVVDLFQNKLRTTLMYTNVSLFIRTRTSTNATRLRQVASHSSESCSSGLSCPSFVIL